MENNYLVWDLETSGLDPNTCDILEIGAIEVQNGEVVAEHSWLLNHEKEVPEVITQITGITEELLAMEGRYPAVCMREMVHLMGKYGQHVTHNGLKFDVPFFCGQLKRLTEEVVPENLMTEFEAELVSKMYDTAVTCKAGKIGMVQFPGETHAQFGKRVMDVRAFGVKYNVGVMCDELGIDRSKITQHRALGDVILTNEIYKKVSQK